MINYYSYCADTNINYSVDSNYFLWNVKRWQIFKNKSTFNCINWTDSKYTLTTQLISDISLVILRLCIKKRRVKGIDQKLMDV